jgi:hypothetical protein
MATLCVQKKSHLMKKALLKSITVVVAFLMFAGCSEKDPIQIEVNGEGDLAGTWLLNEHGYSPGDRYITEPVPATPPRVIKFFTDGRVSSNIGMISEYHFFEIVPDDQTQTPILILYKTAEEAIAKAEPRHSYNMQFSNGELRLSYRFCIEGCHMKFGKIEEAESDK